MSDSTVQFRALGAFFGEGWIRDAPFLLQRDVANVCRYFARYGVEANPTEIAADLWAWFQAGAP